MRVRTTILVFGLAFGLTTTSAAGQERHPLIRTATWAVNRCAAVGDISSECANRVMRDEFISLGQWMAANQNGNSVETAMEICRDLRYIDLMDNARCARATVDCYRATANTQALNVCLDRRLAVELPEEFVMPPGR